jgi:hypothetical protein
MVERGRAMSASSENPAQFRYPDQGGSGQQSVAYSVLWRRAINPRSRTEYGVNHCSVHSLADEKPSLGIRWDTVVLFFTAGLGNGKGGS